MQQTRGQQHNDDCPIDIVIDIDIELCDCCVWKGLDSLFRVATLAAIQAIHIHEQQQQVRASEGESESESLSLNSDGHRWRERETESMHNNDINDKGSESSHGTVRAAREPA